MTNLFLRPQHPAHLTFHTDVGRLQVVVNAEDPLVSWRLQPVTSLSAGSHPSGVAVALGEQTRTRLGLHSYVLRSTQPLTAGWYRLELVGRSEVVQLWIKGH